jgi:hypothetical protein
MTFQRFSQTNKEAAKILKPDLGLRTWAGMKPLDKELIWKQMETFFFKNLPIPIHGQMGSYHMEYVLEAPYEDQQLIRDCIEYSIKTLNELNKSKCFGINYLEKNSQFSACKDFAEIFNHQNEAVVMEMLSGYAEYMLNVPSETEREHGKRLFDEFSKHFNELMSHFSFKYSLTKIGFVSIEDKIIVEDIYKPVIEALSDTKWKEVNQNLSDAFADYRKNTPEDYSTCITKSVSAVQAYLQILVEGKTGGGNIAKLIPEAQVKGLIHKNILTAKIINDIESVLQAERQIKGDAHAKSEYGDAKSARLVLNMAMVFLHHSIID